MVSVALRVATRVRGGLHEQSMTFRFWMTVPTAR